MIKISIFRNTAICFAVFSVILSSCSAPKKQAEIVRRDLAGEVVFKDVFLGIPQDILFYGDFMLIDDQYENKVLSIVDMKSGTLVGRHLSTGRGPGEVMRPYFSIYGDRLYACNDSGMMNIYLLPEMKFIESFEIEGSPDRLKRMADYYVGVGVWSGQGRLQIFDEQGKFLFAGSDFPDNEDNKPNSFGSIVYQGNFCVHPHKNRYVFAAAYSDKIEFHEIRNGKHVLLSESEGEEKVGAEIDDTGNARLAPNVFLGYTRAWGGEDYCYMLYIGKERGTEGVQRGMSDTVRQYDWDGKLVAEYKLDRLVPTIAVDEASGHIYGLALDEEADGGIAIVRFDIGD